MDQGNKFWVDGWWGFWNSFWGVPHCNCMLHPGKMRATLRNEIYLIACQVEFVIIHILFNCI